MKIRPYRTEMRSEWNQYVLKSGQASLFHRMEWKNLIEREFGYEARYLLAEEGGRIRGILPLFLVSNWIQGRALISTPFAVYGGVCADSKAAEIDLQKAACEMAEREAVEYLELRTRYPVAQNGFHVKELYVTFDCSLESDSETLFGRLPKDTRYMVRRGRKNGLRLESDPALLDTFYKIYARSVHHLGTPVFSRHYFATLREEFGEAVEIAVVWQGSQAVAAVLSFRFRDSLLPYYGGSTPEGRELGANNFMYWELIHRACERGLRRYDFGRSKLGTGSYFFKAQWKMEEKPLPYLYYLVRRRTLPNFSPANSRFRIAVELWKHMPLPLTKVLGPAVVRLFP
jgi:FemAB-related protein (PEP-CTERM system-associated)